MTAARAPAATPARVMRPAPVRAAPGPLAMPGAHPDDGTALLPGEFVDF